MTQTYLPSVNQTVNVLFESQYSQQVLMMLLKLGIPFSFQPIVSFEKTVDTSLQKNPEQGINEKILVKNSEDTKLSMKTIDSFMDEYIHTGHIPNISDVSKKYEVSVFFLKNRIRELYGKPFYQLYMDKRMEYAAQLLKQGYRATKVSAMVGYGEKSVIKFNKMFQKHFGMTPKKYQMSQKH